MDYKLATGPPSRSAAARWHNGHGMSDCRRQAHIDAPIEVVWDLIADVERHPEWWPRVVEIECEQLGEGCTYRQVTRTPFGNEDMELGIDSMREPEEFRIHCVNTGHLRALRAHRAQGGTFVDGRMGMDPTGSLQRLRRDRGADLLPPLARCIARGDGGAAEERATWSWSQGAASDALEPAH